MPPAKTPQSPQGRRRLPGAPAAVPAPQSPPPSPASAPGCTVCRHADRPRLEALLADGVSYAAVARKFGLGRNPVARHWTHHVDDERKAALIAGPASLQQVAERAADEGMSLLDHYRAVRGGLYRAYEAAVEAGDRNGVASLAGRLHENLLGWARITGELAKTGVNITQNIFVSPQFADLQATLVRVLARHPECRLARSYTGASRPHSNTTGAR
jgi:hypothetical protein